MPRVGLLGGTFDPVHNGHLALARTARRYCSLDEIWLLPAALPPHKTGEPLTSFAHRARMIELALADEPTLHLSEIEATLPRPSYTIDTLTCLQNQQAQPADYFFIIGADAFLEIRTWKAYHQVLAAVDWIVCGRGPLIREQLRELAHELGYQDQGDDLLDPVSRKQIFLPSQVLPDISSSQIRQRLVEGLPVANLLPSPVLGYLHEHHLYGC